jgi:DNA-binding CsgD family transcriptional regulator
MLVSGTQLHWLTLVILFLEFFMLLFVLWYYYAWPKDKSRLWYFILLALLVVYNLTGGLFPDPQISWLPVPVQNIIAYGSGFGMATFFPYYFYKSFQLDSLRFHALRGAPLFLLLPFVVFFGILYPITGNLDQAISLGMLVPMVYSPVLLGAILNSIKERFKTNDLALYPYGEMEMRAVYLAVSPWVCMSLFSYFHVTQWLEVLITNTGFIIITALFIIRSGKIERMEKERQLARDEIDEKLKMDFQGNCQRHKLTKREIQIADLLCQGLTYEQISENLFIAKRTVDTHVQNIFLKTGVNKKIDLQKILGFAG